jgi:hypothetical protein
MNKVPFGGHLTSTDARRLAKRMAKRQKGVRLSALMMAAGAICLVLAIVQGLNDNSDGALSWFTYGFVIGSIGVGLRWSEGRASRRTILRHENRGYVLDEGVQLVSADSETLFRWTAFTSLDIVDDLLVLWLDNGSALPLAPGLFEDEAAYRRARALVAGGVARG